MPLPIECKPEPESPILGPGGLIDQDVNLAQDGNPLARRASMLSSSTQGEDDVADLETFAAEADGLQKVPTTIEWKGDARAVYITGTFVGWERKFRLHRDPDTGVFSASVPLFPGTHHLKFLVDDEMVASRDYPTTVDFTNALVNYIEVPPEHVSPPPPAPAEPVPIPGAAQASSRSHSHDTRASSPPTTLPFPSTDGAAPRPPARKTLPRPAYTTSVPELFIHLDLYSTPNDPRYQRAAKAAEHLPDPPSLPMFMQKSILNAASASAPHRDDASVLSLPNHTVLNHLATSSIRDGVLATSGTTRYKKKVSRSGPVRCETSR